jgi:hypothetical protein
MRLSFFICMVVTSVICSSGQATTTPAPCLNNPSRMTLDFMVGDWDILVNGEAVAWITLEKDGQDCVIRERYGVPGNSQAGAGITYWDDSTNLWRRMLVTSVGTIETFEGFRSGDKFVWNGREQQLDGATILERVEIWVEGETIRNDIFQSTDGGVIWDLRGSEIRKRRIPMRETNQ